MEIWRENRRQELSIFDGAAFKRLFIAIVPVSLSLGGLRSAGWLGHDDLINRQHGRGHVCGQLQSVQLRVQMVIYTQRAHIRNAVPFDVDSDRAVSSLMR
uniref:Uncharacterized protein n=1 Tax=Spongospora subterranea TaxID=70186 RepID=A0A0H5R7M8_9EUKA|eukprot:CRZ09816.1 hypothetical protein [Spongospora subterranea]